MDKLSMHIEQLEQLSSVQNIKKVLDDLRNDGRIPKGVREEYSQRLQKSFNEGTVEF